jgi:UDPglucose 6-dehydrogenase
MKIAVIGTGYVGLVSGACFSRFGFNVTCIDHDTKKVAQLEAGGIPIYEPGLGDIVAKSRQAGNLKFTSDLALGVAGADVVFIAVGTPTQANSDHADLRYVFEAGRQLAAVMDPLTVVVIKSTVPVGTAAKLREIMNAVHGSGAVYVASNPEFLREGCAVDDFMKPDRVVVGVNTSWSETVLRRLYQPLVDDDVPLVCTTSESAELIKYAANSYLAMRIGFVNQLTDVCAAVDADIADVARGVGLDKRIGVHYFAPGPGYGGSCFPKDTRALAATARDYHFPMTIVEDVINANERRKDGLAKRVAAAVGGNVKDKRIAILGVAFKAETDDIRDAPALNLIPDLQDMGAVVSAFDPAAMDNAARLLKDVQWCRSVEEAAKDADVLVVLTEWDEFRGLDFAVLRQVMKTPVVVDMRNLYRLEHIAAVGFTYHSLGRRTVVG